MYRKGLWSPPGSLLLSSWAEVLPGSGVVGTAREPRRGRVCYLGSAIAPKYLPKRLWIPTVKFPSHGSAVHAGWADRPVRNLGSESCISQ